MKDVYQINTNDLDISKNEHELIEPRKNRGDFLIKDIGVMKKVFTPTTRRCVMISFTSRSSGKMAGEAAGRGCCCCCCCCVDLAIFPRSTRM